MAELLIKFRLELEYHQIPSGALYIPHPHGPLFHRWLPAGESDAIELDTKDPRAALKVWFERHGYVRDGYIEFDEQLKEADPDILATQGKVDAGPLYGLLRIRDISDAEAGLLQAEDLEPEMCIAFDRRIIQLLYQPISCFLDILRLKYGQYWLPEIPEWDSRQESALVYIRRFGFPRWSLDEGQHWHTFQHTSLRLSVAKQRKHQDFREYLSQTDWRELSGILKSGWRPSQAISTLMRAIELFDDGEQKYAIVEVVTALEMALSEFVRERLQTESSSEHTLSLDSLPFLVQLTLGSVVPTKKEKAKATGHSLRMDADGSFGKFHAMDLTDRFHVIANLLNIDASDRQATLKLIGLRNEIVHEGASSPARYLSEFSGVLRCFRRLYPSSQLRFPIAGSGNRRLTPQEWESLGDE